MVRLPRFPSIYRIYVGETRVNKICSIYLIICINNNKLYTGFTSLLVEERWVTHLRDAKLGRNYLLHNAIRKHGEGNFIIKEIYQSWDGEHCLNVMEEYFIRKFKSHMSEGGYNMTWGGEGTIGHKLSEEHKQKISLANIGKKASEETRQKMSNTRKKVGNYPPTRKGESHSEESKKKMSLAKTGRKLSEETKQKMSASAKAAWQKDRKSSLVNS